MKIITSTLLEIKDALNGIMDEDERNRINVNNVDSFKHYVQTEILAEEMLEPVAV